MRKLHRRDVVQLGAAATASAVLPRSVFAQATPSLVIGEARGTGQSAQFSLGVYGGYFQKLGIDVSVRRFNSGAEMGPALMSRTPQQ